MSVEDLSSSKINTQFSQRINYEIRPLLEEYRAFSKPKKKRGLTTMMPEETTKSNSFNTDDRISYYEEIVKKMVKTRNKVKQGKEKINDDCNDWVLDE